VARENLIGEYLRARRELVQPADVGLPQPAGRRRVPGLRREEIAILAGVSADYYVRLEQGRDQHPSAQVLDALARALQLDDDAIAHLHSLAAPAARRRRRPSPRPERVPAGILQLISTWHETPAYVYGRYMDVLAANPLATALAPYYAPGENLVRATFLDARLHDRYEDWDRAAEATVAALRALVGPGADDPQLNELVGELSVRSDRFRQLWARHDARPKRSGTTQIQHPQVGALELNYEKLPIPPTARPCASITPCRAAEALRRSHCSRPPPPRSSTSAGRPVPRQQPERARREPIALRPDWTSGKDVTRSSPAPIGLHHAPGRGA
jgi:transcriptional regulator with XRE-family HTH domain